MNDIKAKMSNNNLCIAEKKTTNASTIGHWKAYGNMA